MTASTWLRWGLMLSPLPAMFLALQIGAYSVPWKEVWQYVLFSSGREAVSEQMWAILFQVRLPRIVLAMLVGVALSASGTTLQAVFRNPLVDAFILGLT